MEKEIYYFHTKDGEYYGGERVTVAGKYIGDELVLSASKCSKKDHFAKATGRNISSNRLNDGIFVSTTTVDFGTFTDDVLREAKRLTFISAARAVADAVHAKGVNVKINLINLDESIMYNVFGVFDTIGSKNEFAYKIE